MTAPQDTLPDAPVQAAGQTPAPPAHPAAPASTAAPRVREDLVTPDPLLDSLIEVCRLHGIAASRASLSAGLPLDKQPLTVALLERAASRAGLAIKLQRTELGHIDRKSVV